MIYIITYDIVFGQVLDASSAPGNKTAHLAALLKGKGKIVACELKRLEGTIRLSSAARIHIEVLHGDFLNLDPKDPAYTEVRAILLDPSCSGSGTAAVRLDYLLPSHAAAEHEHCWELMRWKAKKASSLLYLSGEILSRTWEPAEQVNASTELKM